MLNPARTAAPDRRKEGPADYAVAFRGWPTEKHKCRGLLQGAPAAATKHVLWRRSVQRKREAPPNSAYGLNAAKPDLGVWGRGKEGGDGAQGMSPWSMPELSHLVLTGEEDPTPHRDAERNTWEGAPKERLARVCSVLGIIFVSIAIFFYFVSLKSQLECDFFKEASP